MKDTFIKIGKIQVFEINLFVFNILKSNILHTFLIKLYKWDKNLYIFFFKKTKKTLNWKLMRVFLHFLGKKIFEKLKNNFMKYLIFMV